MNKVSKTNAAYIAGFFDGEGCILSKARTKNPRAIWIRVEMSQKPSEVLYWIQDTLGYGYIKRSRHYLWQTKGKKNVLHFINIILPYSIVKQNQLLIGLELLKTIGSVGVRTSDEIVQKRLGLYKQLRRFKHEDIHKPSRSFTRN